MRYWKPILLLTVIIIGIAYAVCAFAGEPCEHKVNVNASLTARFVTMPDAPPMTAQGSGALCYELGDKEAIIMGESLPTLVFEAIDPPANMDDLTVVIDGMVGTTPVVNWSKFPEIKLTGVDVRARAYGKKFSELSKPDDAMVDIVLSDLTFTTGMVEAEGVSTEGHIDAEKLSVLLVGKAKLPEHGYPQYDEWLAGQPVLLELVVKMENPYTK